MERLHKDWLTDGLIDFEYKKYILLAYLKDIKQRFDAVELYPFLSDLVFHYQNLMKIKDQKRLYYDNFPKQISRADFNKLELSYKKMVQDDETMKQIEDILEYAIPRVKATLRDGKELFEFVEQQIEISPVGVTPLYSDEGYMFIQTERSNDVDIYRYQLSVFENANENFRSLKTEFINKTVKSVANTYEAIKLDLARNFKQLPNPASFLVFSKLSFPMPNTLLPVAKRLLIRHISTT